MWVEYPQDPKTVDMEDQFLIGRDILVKPVTAPNQQQTVVYLPSEDVPLIHPTIAADKS